MNCIWEISCTTSICRCEQQYFVISLHGIQKYMTIIQGYLIIYKSTTEEPHWFRACFKRGPKYWDELPENIKMTLTTDPFNVLYRIM